MKIFLNKILIHTLHVLIKDCNENFSYIASSLYRIFDNYFKHFINEFVKQIFGKRKVNYENYNNKIIKDLQKVKRSEESAMRFLETMFDRYGRLLARHPFPFIVSL